MFQLHLVQKTFLLLWLGWKCPSPSKGESESDDVGITIFDRREIDWVRLSIIFSISEITTKLTHYTRCLYISLLSTKRKQREDNRERENEGEKKGRKDIYYDGKDIQDGAMNIRNNKAQKKIVRV